MIETSRTAQLYERSHDAGTPAVFCAPEARAIDCANCGFHNSAGKKFCTNCGTALARACANCGSGLDAGERFCGECGTPVADVAPAATASSAPAAPAKTPATAVADPGERRFVTVLFADLVGFTPFSEQRDAEDVRAMLTRYFDRASEIVERFGGTIDKFIGDAVMAVWGAETALEDDAERGVRTALELVDAVAALGEEIGVPDLKARAGVLSGEASVGSGGNEKGLVVGDLVNTASRLQSIAEPGTVLVGTSTRDLVQASIELAPVGEHSVKGKQTPVQAWRAVRVVSGRRGEWRADGLVSPFVGREHEMRLLKDMLAATSRERRARLISIVGEGGIGKTRLAEEFLHYIDGLAEVIYWHQGRSPSYGSGLAFWALGEMVRRRCGIAEGDDEHRTMTKLRTTLAEYVTDGGDRAWLEPRLAGLLGVAPMPTGDRAELFSAWRTFFERIAEQGTTVMVFEDLHWADEGMVDFVDELSARAPGSPILVVTLARPELLERHPGWGSGRANTMSMHLAPLADIDVDDLVKGMIPGSGSEVAQYVVGQAAGVPLYAVELVRMLVNDGTVVARDGAYETVGTIANLAVPDSLNGVVGARIDRLPPESRELLQDAAVLGQAFTLTGLAALRDADEATLEQLLEPFVEQALIQVERDPRSPERGQYKFVQSLIREVAYSRISRAERRAKHLAVADYFEQRAEQELAGAVAAHYLGAVEASSTDAEAAELAGRAVRSLRTAAERAAELQSHRQAIALAMQAIDIATTAGQEGPLWVLAARSAHAAVDDRAEEFARRAVELLRDAGDEEELLRAARALATIYNDSQQPTRAIELLEPIFASVESRTTAEFAKLAAELARAHAMSGASEEWKEPVEAALIVAERLELIPTITDALITRGTSLATTGRPREGTALLHTALELAEEHDLGHSLMRSLNNLAYIAISDSVASLPEYTERRLDHALRIGDPLLILDSRLIMAQELALAGQWAGMERLVDDIREDTDVDALTGSLRWRWSDLDRIAVMHREDVERATRMFDDIVATYEADIGREVDDPQALLAVGSVRSALAMLSGDAERAFAVAIAMNDPTPNFHDVVGATPPALFLQDPEKLGEVGARAREVLYRGARIDAWRAVIEGATSVVDGDEARGAAVLVDAADALERYEYTPEAAMTIALSARLLGTSTRAGAALGAVAARLCREHQLVTTARLLPDGLAETADERETAAGA